VSERQRPQLLLFDLGGVLVEYSGLEDIKPFLEGGLREAASDAEIGRRFADSESLAAFQTGSLTPAEFGARFVSEWRLTIEPEAFLREFESWTRRLYPGARELLESLRPRYRLAALSNSNALHWRRNAAVLGVPALFEAAFSSHEIGVLKPDRAAFEHALAALDVAPATVAFFDDLAANVEAARALGIAAFRVEGVAELRAALTGRGVL